MNFAVRYRRFIPALVAAGVLAEMGSQAAYAQAILTPGQSGQLAPSTSFFGGTLVQQSSFAFNQASLIDPSLIVSGTLYSAAYIGGTGATGLDFYYQVVLNNSTSVTVDNFNVAGFATQTNVSANTSVAQTTSAATGSSIGAGTFATATDDRSSGTGSTIFFNFANTGNAQFSANQTSQTQIIRTNATNLRIVSAAVTGGGVAANAAALGVSNPAAAAPEPGSLALLGTGLMSLGGVAVRRRRAKK